MERPVVPADLEAIITRITAPQVASSEPVAAGELARLDRWWRSVSDGGAPRVATLRSAGTMLEAGIADADRAIDGGHTLLVPRVTHRDPVGALTVIALLTRSEAQAITSQPAGMSDRAWVERCAAVRDSIIEFADLRAAPAELLFALNATEIAFVVGALLASAARRTPSIIEGTDELAAALVADRLSFRAKDWWRASSTSSDPARKAAVDRLDLTAGLPLELTDEDGRGAEATVALLNLVSDAADAT